MVAEEVQEQPSYYGNDKGVIDMKIFKYFTWSEIKDICKRLESCEFRHPKDDFNKAIGELNVMKLVDIGFLKDSPRNENEYKTLHRNEIASIEFIKY